MLFLLFLLFLHFDLYLCLHHYVECDLTKQSFRKSYLLHKKRQL